MKETSTIDHTMDDRQKLETLANQIAQQGGYYEGLTEAKIFERGVVINDPTRSAWIVVDVTRHKAVLGTIYRRGSPMSAFVEYQQRVALNPDTNELQIDPQGIVHDGARLVIDYDSFGDDSVDHNRFDFESSADGSVMCREVLSRDTCVVATQEDVEEFAREICENWYLGHFEEELSEYFSHDETKEHMSRILSAMETALVAKAVSAWRYFNTEVRTSAKRPTPTPARSLTRASAVRLRASRKRCP